MFNTIIKFSIKQRYLVLFASTLLIFLGIYSFKDLVIDAVPDITNVQVQINTEASGYSPFEAEQRISTPIELLLSGIPKLTHTRSLSRYGLSQVTAIFQDGTDIHFARQQISQKLQEAKELLPEGISPTMGPIATGLGEIFMFVVENDKAQSSDRQNQYTLQELREIQDWVIKPQLRTIPGVVEINSIGGASKQIVITPNLTKLQAYGLTFKDLSEAVSQNNLNVGAGFIEENGQQFLIRVPAQVSDYQALNDIIVKVHGGKLIRIRDLAEVIISSELRAGAATEDGQEVVLGTVFMLMGENGRDVSNRVSEKLISISKTLPNGVKVKPVYNRSILIDATLGTVRTNLVEGALLVIAVLFFALGNLRAALITACVIPLSMLLTIFGMVQGKLSANLMSLGALDFGLIVDGAVILVENCIKRISEKQKELGRTLLKEERLNLIFEASSEVRQATMFGELIIMIVYIPILALSGIEGKMYHPMALTVLLALAGAFILSLTFVPASVAIFVRGKIKEEKESFLKLHQNYGIFLEKALRLRGIILILVLFFFLASLGLFKQLGSEFMPALDEGDISLHALRIPGTSLSQAINQQHQLENAIKKMPEVSHAFAKIGTAEIATDPMPPSVADGFIMLKPRDQWPDPRKPKRQIVKELETIVNKIPANNYEFTQPIEMRFNELIAGVRSDVAVKLFGDDPDILLSKGEEIERLVASLAGSSDVKIEQITGLPIVEITPKRDVIARLGLNVSNIQSIIQAAYAGQEVSKYYEGDRNFPIVIRLAEKVRHNVDSIKLLPIPLPPPPETSKDVFDPNRSNLLHRIPNKQFIILGDIADVRINQSPNQISHENGKRRIVVTANIRNRDLGTFVEDLKGKLNSDIKIPANYWIAVGGQYENLVSAKERLMIVVPLVLLSVFAMIFFTFKSIRYALIVFSGVPFALTGGIIAIWLRDIPFSISAAVGFIALSGVSVLNGLVLVSFTKKLLDSGLDIKAAIINGAVSRLRPVLMTASVASLGFLPMAFSRGTGSEVQIPLATVVIGGIISSTILTLIVLPILISLLPVKRS